MLEALDSFLEGHNLWGPDSLMFPELLDKMYQNYKAAAWDKSAQAALEADDKFEEEMWNLYTNDSRVMRLKDDATMAREGYMGTGEQLKRDKQQKRIMKVRRIMFSKKNWIDQVLERTMNLADIEMARAKAEREAWELSENVGVVTRKIEQTLDHLSEEFVWLNAEAAFLEEQKVLSEQIAEGRRLHEAEALKEESPGKAAAVKEADMAANEMELKLLKLRHEGLEPFLEKAAEQGIDAESDPCSTLTRACASQGLVASANRSCSLFVQQTDIGTNPDQPDSGPCPIPGAQGVGLDMGLMSLTELGAPKEEEDRAKKTKLLKKFRAGLRDATDDWQEGADGGFVGVQKSPKEHWFATVEDPRDNLDTWIQLYGPIMRGDRESKRNVTQFNKKVETLMANDKLTEHAGDFPKLRWREQHLEATGSASALAAARQRARNLFELYVATDRFANNLDENMQTGLIIGTPNRDGTDTVKWAGDVNGEYYDSRFSTGEHGEYAVDEDHVEDMALWLQDWFEALAARCEEKFPADLSEETGVEPEKESTMSLFSELLAAGCGEGRASKLREGCTPARGNGSNVCGTLTAAKRRSLAEHPTLEEYRQTDPQVHLLASARPPATPDTPPGAGCPS